MKREFTEEHKKEIKERDNFVCVVCGKRERKRIYPIHHIDYDKKNNASINLVTLCRSCHTKTNFNRDSWIKYFGDMLKNEREKEVLYGPSV